jgi:hypothetical protein
MRRTSSSGATEAIATSWSSDACIGCGSLRVPVTGTSEIVNGRRSITAETALRLARYVTLVRDASRPDRSDPPAHIRDGRCHGQQHDRGDGAAQFTTHQVKNPAQIITIMTPAAAQETSHR